MEQLNDILTLAEAADELGLAQVSLRAAVSRGTLRARLIGKTYVTTRDEVVRYRREHLGQVGRPAGDPPRHRSWNEIKRMKGAPVDD